MPNAQQKALNAHRRRRRERGLVRVEVQVPAVDAPMLRDVAAVLRGAPGAAQAMRDQLRSAIPQPMSVFDMFGSDLPDAYFEGVFDSIRQKDTGRDVPL
jgi:hypothetical protein